MTRTITVIDRRTGEGFTVSPELARIARLRRRVFAWAAVMQEVKENRPSDWLIMVTLTYASPYEWKPGHIRQFTLAIRKVLGEKLVGYAWVAELQKRGAIHYHYLLHVKRGAHIPKPDRARLWVHGMTKVEKARTPYYVCKYTSKGSESERGTYPRGARVFATYVSREARDTSGHYNYKSSVYPKWVRALIDTGNYGSVARRERGGGWRLGEYTFESPYYSRLD